MPEFYPPVGFYFSVSFLGMSAIDAAFHEVSGISASVNTEEYEASGENGTKYRLPTGITYSKLILKRGLVPFNSQIGAWCMSIVEGFRSKIQPKDILVSLLDAKGNPLLTWAFYNAWPTKWELSGFNAEENSILMETIELDYSRFERV